MASPADADGFGPTSTQPDPRKCVSLPCRRDRRLVVSRIIDVAVLACEPYTPELHRAEAYVETYPNHRMGAYPVWKAQRTGRRSADAAGVAPGPAACRRRGS